VGNSHPPTKGMIPISTLWTLVTIGIVLAGVTITYLIITINNDKNKRGKK
jgi:uncharacterized membrane-anchored protein YhcB (DUF1043 family)